MARHLALLALLALGALGRSALLALPRAAHGHGYLAVPPARNVHFNFPVGGIQNLNAGGPGSERGAGHGLCGGTPDHARFSTPGPYSPSPVQASLPRGNSFDATVQIRAHHQGWFEFRLCTEYARFSQECLNEHVLEFDRDHALASYGPDDMARGLMHPMDYIGEATNNYGHRHSAVCENIPASPSGSCCNGGGTCSDPAANTDRWMLPKSGIDNNRYTIRLRIPSDIELSEHAVLQWYYQTGNSVDGYPEGFWNCADVAVVEGDGTTQPPTPAAPTAPPTPAAPTAPPTPAAAPTASSNCQRAWGKCGGVGFTGSTCCQPGNVCKRQSRWYSQCVPGVSAPTTPPTAAAPTLAPPTAPPTPAPPTAPPTPAPPTASSNCQRAWGKCGGVGFTGSTCCQSGSECKQQSRWYSQCTPAAPVASPTTAAPTSPPTTAAPTTAAPTSSPTTAAPTSSPTTTPPTSSPTPSPPTTASPTSAPTTPAPTSAPTTPAPTAPTSLNEMFFNKLSAVSPRMQSEVLIYETPTSQWVPSTIYKPTDMIAALRLLAVDNAIGDGKFVTELDGDARYGLVNLAAFLAQAKQEAIRYNACDENSWDLINGRYPISNACGQLGQKYDEYHGEYECSVDPNMRITATTNAKWYGAPQPLYCAPKSDTVVDTGEHGTGAWDYSYECRKPWANPPEACSVYEGQKAGREDNSVLIANGAGRTDVEGCCWWGRGVIQSTGVGNYGYLNHFIGAKAAREGRNALFPDVDFCRTPDAICASEKYPELKWVAGLFYWIQSVQAYDDGTWNYMENLRAFVDGGMRDGGAFITSVSGIVNRGCANPPCATGDVHAKAERAQNFVQMMNMVL